MARRRKNTVDYFPHIIEGGKSMFIIESTYGNNGYAVWYKILERLGKSENHYIDLSDDKEVMYVASKCNVDQNLLLKIIGDLASLGQFDKRLWEKQKVIWSQKFMNSIADVYRRRDSEIPTYKLICEHLELNADGSTQSKVKDSKVKDSKVDKSKGDKTKSIKDKIKDAKGDGGFQKAFDEIRLMYPGVRRAVEIEQDNFLQKCGKFKLDPYKTLPSMKLGILKQIEIRIKKKSHNEFIPEWKHFKTWVNNQGWTEEEGDSGGGPKTIGKKS